MNLKQVTRIVLLVAACGILYLMLRQTNLLSSEGYTEPQIVNTPAQRATVDAALQPGLPPYAAPASSTMPANYEVATALGGAPLEASPFPAHAPGTPEVPVASTSVGPAPVSATVRPVSQPAGWEENPESCFPKDPLTAEDLLPKDMDPKWAELHPEGQGSLRDRNFLEAGYLTGINTVGQVMKNANYSLRSDPVIPRIPNVAPWGVSSIDMNDQYRKEFEIGGC